MLMPFWSFSNSTGFAESTPTLYFSYTCILFNYQNATDWPEPDFWFRDTPTVVAAFIVCIPSIYFNHRLSRKRKGKSILDIGSATFFSTASLAAYFAYCFPPNELATFVPSLDWDLLNFASVVLLFLVLLPVFAREASRLGVERSLRPTRKPHPRTRRNVPPTSASMTYSVLGYLAGFVLCLLPFILIINIWPGANYEYDSISVMASMNHRYFQVPPDWTFSEFRLRIPGLIHLVDLLVFTGFRTLFSYNLIRYCRGYASRRRVVSYGIAGVLIPIAYFYIMQSEYAFGDVTYLIPLPIVFIVGFLVLQIVSPLEPRTDAEERPPEIIFKEVERRDPYDDYVKVPVFYSIRSRIGRAISRLKSRHSDGATPDNKIQIHDESTESEVRDSD